MQLYSVKTAEPYFYNIFEFENFGAAEKEEIKRSRTYRFMYIQSGSLEFIHRGERRKIPPNSLIFMPPGTQYATLFGAQKLTVYNLFFGFEEISHEPEISYLFRFAKINKMPFCDFEPLNDFFYIENFENGGLFKLLYNRCLKQDYLSDTLPHSLFLQIYNAYLDGFKPFIPSEEQLARRIESNIEKYIFDEISCSKIAAAVGYHINHINKVFKKTRQMPFSAVIMRKKIDAAKKMLAADNLTVTQIAAELCFYDASHFNKNFIKITGITPLNFRKKMRHQPL